MTKVDHDLSAHSFTIDSEGAGGFLRYSREGERLILLHTEVPVVAEGKGHGGALVRAALAYASDEGLQVVPVCSFAKSYMKKHGT